VINAINNPLTKGGAQWNYTPDWISIQEILTSASWTKDSIIFYFISKFFPQQLPGPAQAASSGDDPQHAVSPRPGILFLRGPDMDEWAERSFFK
jgi:hypothetical protein